MSEARRALFALGGVVFPKAGDVGIYSVRFELTGFRFVEFDESYRSVVVLRVSKSGSTIWTRFTHVEAQSRYGAGIHEWRREADRLYYRRKDPKGGVRFG